MTHQLFPEIEPYASGHLQVSELHRIYWEESGNKNGKPVVILHGGPGAGSSPLMRRFHDPEHYRIIVLDQRGCGRSTPFAELEENTTWHLVEDLEKLRKFLGVDKWQVFGGSWGSTLALAYAQSHPEVVTEIILRGIFTVRRSEVQWFNQWGASELFPDEFELYKSFIPGDEQDDLVEAYHRRLTCDDEAVRLEAARRWTRWEAATLSVIPDPLRVEALVEPQIALAFARIECHYFRNQGFFERQEQLLEDVGRIRHIPAQIIQGRYDVVTPMRTAWELANRWPEAQFVVVEDAGHTMTEPGITQALLAATEAFK
ncbi:prolyl aminopeptidase [Rhodobacteraceae bacterium RKSG542]|uniref:prolyl aminopeptidase n=1 Tax=Pseudovibrio flavus TaxID=2529854 RepID=UPI0035297153|nr:prolyl aminopeptidase [Pseudovibrio flavus]